MSDKKPDQPHDHDDETVKERHTTHWDLDYLPRDEVEELMNQPRKDAPPPERQVKEDDEPIETMENPRRIAALLLLGAVALFTIGILLLRL